MLVDLSKKEMKTIIEALQFQMVESESLDRAGIELSQDSELSIRIYDDEYEGDFDGREYDE